MVIVTGNYTDSTASSVEDLITQRNTEMNGLSPHLYNLAGDKPKDNEKDIQTEPGKMCLHQC